jgi:hypothetical protein
MRLIGSSIPGAVERDAALRLLSERAVLTRMLCRELLDAKAHLPDRRAVTALSMLLGWIALNFPESVRVEPHASDGLDRMVVPEGGQKLHAEVLDGSQVAESLSFLMTADTTRQSAQDEAVLRERLASYWAKHGVAVRPPWFVDGHWASFEEI